MLLHTQCSGKVPLVTLEPRPEGNESGSHVGIRERAFQSGSVE